MRVRTPRTVERALLDSGLLEPGRRRLLPWLLATARTVRPWMPVTPLTPQDRAGRGSRYPAFA